MSDPADAETARLAKVYARAVEARDPRFDGVFFVGITTTRIYCRPVCPARVSYPERRRFFDSAAAAERAGYRPCLRCRPELAPGRAIMDAVPRLARVAACRIAAGALNGRSVADLASDLGVSDRHLRRALEREVGVTPIELALTHRLLLAKRLLADTHLPVTQIAFASGFQSLRRFNAVFRERYRMSPSAVRRSDPSRGARDGVAGGHGRPDFVRLTLTYRAPLAWRALLALLRREMAPGVDAVDGSRYLTTVRIAGHAGVVAVEDAALGDRSGALARHHVNVDLSVELLPVLMPLLARLRHLLDLDADPTVIDAHLEASGLGALVRARPGVRVPGAVDSFDLALRVLLRWNVRAPAVANEVVSRVVHALGDPLSTDVAGLCRLAPAACRVAHGGAAELVSLGASEGVATQLAAVARAVSEGSVRLEPGADPEATVRALRSLGVGDDAAAYIAMRALRWPDAFPAREPRVQTTAGGRTDACRPWRAYAAMHLWLHDSEPLRRSMRAS